MVVAVLVVVAVVISTILSRRDGDAPEQGASWVVPWLVGLLVISWVGSYPEPAAGNLGVLGFGTAIPVLFVFSGLIYALALRFPLPREEIEQHIEDSLHESEVEEETLQST